MQIRIDHVTLAAADLETARSRFADLGLATEYGGAHSNGITHMALLGFGDGSYIELISTIQRGAGSPLWDRQIRGDGGPAAWAVSVGDLSAEKQRLAAAGIRSGGPAPMTRARPDGVRLEWELLFPGDAPAGALLPFAISDRTPRKLRVQPSIGAAGAGLSGVAQVVIAVRAIGPAAELFQRAYGWAEPILSRNDALGARLAAFAGTPVVLAEPVATGRPGWLAERLDRYGESPTAFLLRGSAQGPALARGSDSERTSASATAHPGTRLPLLPAEPWPGAEVAWIDPARLFGWRVGLLFGR